MNSIREHLRRARHPNTSAALILEETHGGGSSRDESIKNVGEALTLEGYARVFRAERGNGEFDGWVKQTA